MKNYILICESINECTNENNSISHCHCHSLLTVFQRDSTLLTIINLESLIFTLLLVAIMDILIKSPHKINRYWWKLLSHMNVAGNVV